MITIERHQVWSGRECPRRLATTSIDHIPTACPASRWPGQMMVRHEHPSQTLTLPAHRARLPPQKRTP